MSHSQPATSLADLEVRRATQDDADAVVDLTSRIWTDRNGDYLTHAYTDWLEEPGADSKHTFLAVDGDTVAGIVQAVMLSADEAWFQGLRVHPEYRRLGLSRRLNDACFDWALERGATVGRLMIFSWNAPALRATRSAGFDPATEFRWAHPEPDAAAEPAACDALIVGDHVDRAWRYWTHSDARDHLSGLTLDPEESWAVRELTRADLEWLADERAVFTVDRPDQGVVATGYRSRTYERTTDDGTTERWAEYGVGAWDDVDAARSLFAGIARDAADLEADRTRVLIPESVEAVSDASYAGASISEEPDFVLAIDLAGLESS